MWKKYKITYSKQYGFQEGLSTEDAISKLTTNIYSTLDDPIQLSLLILSKAFDTGNPIKINKNLRPFAFIR